MASLIGCYDGDTCTLRLANAPPFIAEQKFRFEGFDTPEIRGKCPQETGLAKRARGVTLAYMQGAPLLTTKGKRGGGPGRT